jgi:hypothetical protein
MPGEDFRIWLPPFLGFAQLVALAGTLIALFPL